VPAIVSASRRTDLPGWHADWLARRLGRLRRPPDALFLWTKHPGRLVERSLLRTAVAALPNVFVHLTITGLGDGPLEPRAPAWKAAAATVPELVRVLGGDGRRVLWRFDPVLPSAASQETFARLADRLARAGVRRCIASFLSSLSLKGSLLPQYARFGLAPSPLAEKIDWAGRLAATAAAAGLELRLCCQPKVVERLAGAVAPAACIDAELATALHPLGVVVAGGRDVSQRRHCRCAPSTDLGDYAAHPCRTGCAYCYSKAGGPDLPENAPRGALFS
jgi:DNA repair photolyase